MQRNAVTGEIKKKIIMKIKKKRLVIGLREEEWLALKYSNNEKSKKLFPLMLVYDRI